MSDISSKLSPDISIKIQGMTIEQQDRIAAIVDQIMAEPPPEPIPTGAEIATAFEALDERGKIRLVERLTQIQDRMANG